MKKIQPAKIQYGEVHIVQGSSLKQLLNNLQIHIDEQEIKTAWVITMFESSKRNWQAVLTKPV